MLGFIMFPWDLKFTMFGWDVTFTMIFDGICLMDLMVPGGICEGYHLEIRFAIENQCNSWVNHGDGPWLPWWTRLGHLPSV